MSQYGAPPLDPSAGGGPTATPAADDAVTPVCYRHPDRETYIRCQRCGRPICPEDMHPASVGFQCPECIREGNASVRQPRTVLGGGIHSRDGLVTRVVIGLCVLAFGAQQFVPAFGSRLELFGGFHGGAAVVGGDAGVAGGEVWRLLTAGFLHANLVHLGVNMFSLWVLGRPLEAALGRVRFIGLYLAGLLGSSAVAYLLTPPNVAVVGASGAIFALLGALFVLGRRLGLDTRSLTGLLVINLVISFAVPGISWQAHVGGLVSGALVAAGLSLAARRRTPVLAGAGYAVVVVAAVIVVVLRTAALTI